MPHSYGASFAADGRRGANRRDATKLMADQIGIENARRVAVRIEVQQCAGLVEVESIRQPIEGAGVIVLDVDGHRDRPPRDRSTSGGNSNQQNRETAPHRAG